MTWWMIVGAAIGVAAFLLFWAAVRVGALADQAAQEPDPYETWRGDDPGVEQVVMIIPVTRRDLDDGWISGIGPIAGGPYDPLEDD